MIDMEKVIKGLEWILNDIEENGHYQVGYYADEIRKALALLKEQEAKERCLKTKCVICQHCEHCDVDENGLLKEQEPVRPTWLQGKAYCGSCGHGFPRKSADREINYCSFCGQAVKWSE